MGFSFRGCVSFRCMGVFFGGNFDLRSLLMWECGTMYGVSRIPYRVNCTTYSVCVVRWICIGEDLVKVCGFRCILQCGWRVCITVVRSTLMQSPSVRGGKRVYHICVPRHTDPWNAKGNCSKVNAVRRCSICSYSVGESNRRCADV